MPIDFRVIIFILELILTLTILFVVFDTIKRTKGKFNRGWKVLFLAFSLFFIFNVIENLSELYNLGVKVKLMNNILEVLFVMVMLVTVVIVNKKVKEVSYHEKKK